MARKIAALCAALVIALCSSGAYAETEADALFFHAHPKDAIYSGPTRLPDFRRRDRAFREFRTRIVKGMRGQPNFAGHFFVVEIGCGTGCLITYVADAMTGKVSQFPLEGEAAPSLRLFYHRSSEGLLAYWTTDDRCLREGFTWDGNQFHSEKTKDVGKDDVCFQLDPE